MSALGQKQADCAGGKPARATDTRHKAGSFGLLFPQSNREG